MEIAAGGERTACGALQLEVKVFKAPVSFSATCYERWARIKPSGQKT